VLKPDNHRKLWAFYCTFAEFGRSLLRGEALWMPCGVLRTKLADVLQGGFSAALVPLLDIMTHEGTMSPSGTGVALRFASGSRLLFSKMGKYIADEAALKKAIGCKGASGLMPCMLHKNICSIRSELAEHDPIGQLVSIACSDRGRFERRSDEDLHAAADELAALHGTMPASRFSAHEKARGLNHNPHGILLRIPLREHFKPVSSCSYDPMHVFYQNGVCSVELFWAMRKLVDEGASWAAVSQWIRDAGLRWPHAHQDKGAALHRCFNKSRESGTKARTSSDFKGTATEAMMLVPVVRHFFEAVVLAGRGAVFERVARRLAPCAASFSAMADVAVLLQRAKLAENASAYADLLKEKTASHLEAFKTAYGEGCVIFKHHMMMDVPEQLGDVFLDTFPMERKHQMTTAAADPVHRVRPGLSDCEFEKIVLSKMMHGQLASLEKIELQDGLRGRRVLDPATGICVADGVRHNSLTVRKDDVVLIDEPLAAAVVACCISSASHGGLALVVRPLMLQRMGRGFSVWLRGPGYDRWSLHCGVRHASFWYAGDAGSLVVVS
jgi:hypothetical protein